jgi:hypothetical protein
MACRCQHCQKDWCKNWSKNICRRRAIALLLKGCWQNNQRSLEDKQHWAPTKKQEVWQGGGSHWNKDKVCEGAPSMIIETVAYGGMKLMGVERRPSVAVGVATLEE